MEFTDLFCQATGHQPYPYQIRLADEPWADLVDIPTGLGKTAAVTLAWLHKRRSGDENTPRRLIWCLPMRVLAEQAFLNISAWLDALNMRGEPGEGRVSVHLLMGGAEGVKAASWAEHPEEECILVGTQDMLLSRALMRGYGMSRYQWPVHFALLHNDALWVMDEVQLMGAALPTSAQLEAFRRSLPFAKRCRTVWLSATLNREWLATVDFRRHVEQLSCATLDATERDLPAVAERLRAVKQFAWAETCLESSDLKAYAAALAREIRSAHRTGTTTLVIVNQVARAQALRRQFKDGDEAPQLLLLHSAFRPTERTEIQARLRAAPPPAGRIIIATQAIEAGVDLTSRTLFTELAPWPSLVQRFGRCNRYGEYNADGGARVFCIDTADDPKLALPYESHALAAARAKLAMLRDASAAPADLPPTDEAAPPWPVLRRRDLIGLFSIDSDLSGFDVDISDYIRDIERPPVALFWRDFTDSPDGQPPPARDELCPVSIGAVQGLKGRDRWRWDSLGRRWVALDGPPRPGMTLLLRAADGGYEPALGFSPESRTRVAPCPETEVPEVDAYDANWRSLQRFPVTLAHHLCDVAQEAQRLCAALAEPADAVVRAARWHDVGKAHPAFQHLLFPDPAQRRDEMWAKSSSTGGRAATLEGEPPELVERKHFRHELASMLAWIELHDGEEDTDLIAYLIAAHHGKVRTSLRALPDEREPPGGDRRYARGVWEGDTLPAFEFDGEVLPETRLRLALMELGLGEQGPSWAERTRRLLAEHGPFRLAWLETLVRLSDWRASRAEQADAASRMSAERSEQ